MSWNLALQQIANGPKIGMAVSSSMRTCTVCEQTKPLTEFYEYVTNQGSKLRRFKCTACYRANKNLNARARYKAGKIKATKRAR